MSVDAGRGHAHMGQFESNRPIDAIPVLRLIGLEVPVYDTRSAKSADQEGAMNFWGKLPPWMVMTVIGVAGLALVLIPRVLQWSWDFGVLPEIGIALLVASILGFTIQRWMNRDLAKDVFWASIGHMLRPELRSEISWICGFKFLATRSVLTVDIEPIGDDLVKVTTSVDREIENIGAEQQSLGNVFSIDEWGMPGHQSTITVCKIRKEGDEPIGFRDITSDDAAEIRTKTAEVSLRPGERVHVSSQGIEYKRMNDLLHFAFTLPTLNPQIVVNVPSTLDCRYYFSHRGEIEKEQFTPRKTLKGTYLPSAHTGVRWWPKKQIG